MIFSNPRQFAEFEDWPSGRNRVKCKFVVETNKKGSRVLRSTTDKFGNWCKPKATTYCDKSCIVDGEDGKTYILQKSDMYGMVSVMRHDFMSAENSSYVKSIEPDKYAELVALIDAAK